MTGNNHHNFAERAKQERSRAEALLSLPVDGAHRRQRPQSGSLRRRKPAAPLKPAEVCRDLEVGLRSSLRNSDVVAALDRNRIGLLLMETSRSGLEIVRRRVDSFVRDYAKAPLQLPFEPQVAIQDASYPEESDRFSELAEKLPR